MSEEVGNLKGDVFALVSHSRSSNVFARTELLSALSYKEGTINGLPRDELYKAYEEQFNELLGENPEVTVNDIKYYELRTQALEVALKPVMDRCDEIIEDIYVCVNDEIDNDSFELDLSGSEFFHHQKNPNITNEYTRIPFREYMKAAEEIGQMLGEGKAIFKCDPDPEKGKVEKLSSNIADIRPQTVSLYMQGKEIRQMYVGVIETRKKDVEKQQGITEPEKADCQTEKKEFLKIVKSDKSTVAELTKCFDKVKEKGKEANEQGGQNKEKSEKKSKNDQDRCL